MKSHVNYHTSLAKTFFPSDVNGKTLHIVQRPPPLAPPTAGLAGRSTAAPPPSTTAFNGGRRTMSGQVSTSANVVVGSVGIPHDAIDPAQIQVGVVQAADAHNVSTVWHG